MPPPRSAVVFLDPHFTVGEIDPMLFGSFVEHLGRCVYTGLFEPDHPAADAAGLRTDVLALVRELGVTMVRYPGGNFVSAYRWEDGVGPADLRPRRLDPAWRTIETNRFGLGEFTAFTRAAGLEPMMAVNLGTRGPAEAADLLEYCNHPSGTTLSDLRGAHGAPEPYGIRLWCLGNELDGPWQVGHKTADEYGRLAAETARLMRMIDPSVRLIACGSSGSGMPTFGEWESTVLAHAYDQVDYISLHAYYDPEADDPASYLASACDMERFITDVTALCDAARARHRSAKRLSLSFDEWNIWYMSRQRPGQGEWPRAPRLLEDVYTVTDAVVFGTLLITLLRHCDRVTAACLAQLVNVIAPIMTEPGGPAWRQTVFHPFAQAARYGRGQVLRLHTESPTYETPKFGDVPLLHATAVHGEDGVLTVFAVNRDPAADLPLTVHLGGFAVAGPAVHSVLADDDPSAVNTMTAPNRVTPRILGAPEVENGRLTAVLPPLSWNVLRLPLAPGH
jgi:alpha-N-arabinofuranosidase